MPSTAGPLRVLRARWPPRQSPFVLNFVQLGRDSVLPTIVMREYISHHHPVSYSGWLIFIVMST